MKHETYNLTPFDDMMPLYSRSRVKAYRSLRRKSERRYYRSHYAQRIRSKMSLVAKAFGGGLKGHHLLHHYASQVATSNGTFSSGLES